MENVQTEVNNHIATVASAVSCSRQSFIGYFLLALTSTILVLTHSFNLRYRLKMSLTSLGMIFIQFLLPQLSIIVTHVLILHQPMRR